jgi:hypothetical protein
MTKCAETGLTPPATGVAVKAIGWPNGFRILNILLGKTVSTRQMPTN